MFRPTPLLLLALLLVVGCQVAGPPLDPAVEANVGVQGAYSVELPLALSSDVSIPVELGYWLYLPEDYGKDREQAWPVILFLHGRGERGDDLELLKKHGLPKLLDQGEDYPFIIVSPQCPLSTYWPDLVGVLPGLLEHLGDGYAVDTERIYVTGLSMGGMGTWALALLDPELPAAIAPIAGRSPYAIVPGNMCDIKHVPTWVFHGAQDDLIPVEDGQAMVDALRACGADVRFTLYPDADHPGSWERAYADPELYEWLLEQSRREIKTSR